MNNNLKLKRVDNKDPITKLKVNICLFNEKGKIENNKIVNLSSFLKKINH